MKSLRGQRLGERVLALLLPARDQVEPALERRDQPRQLGRVVLQVGVHGHDHSPRASPEAGRQRGRLAVVAAEGDAAHARVGGGEPREHRVGAVARAVVDVEDLPRPARRRRAPPASSRCSSGRLSASFQAGTTTEMRIGAAVSPPAPFTPVPPRRACGPTRPRPRAPARCRPRAHTQRRSQPAWRRRACAAGRPAAAARSARSAFTPSAPLEQRDRLAHARPASRRRRCRRRRGRAALPRRGRLASTASATKVKSRDCVAVAVDGDRLAAQHRAAEAVERHVGPLARPVDREVAQRHGRQAEVAAVEQHEMLARELGDAVRARTGAAARPRRRQALGVAVDRRRAGVDEALAAGRPGSARAAAAWPARCAARRRRTRVPHDGPHARLGRLVEDDVDRLAGRRGRRRPGRAREAGTPGARQHRGEVGAA